MSKTSIYPYVGHFFFITSVTLPKVLLPQSCEFYNQRMWLRKGEKRIPAVLFSVLRIDVLSYLFLVMSCLFFLNDFAYCSLQVAKTLCNFMVRKVGCKASRSTFLVCITSVEHHTLCVGYSWQMVCYPICVELLPLVWKGDRKLQDLHQQTKSGSQMICLYLHVKNVYKSELLLGIQ